MPIQNNPSYKTYLALGDSYTIGESISPEKTYPMQAVRLLKKQGFLFEEPKIIATTGWTTGDLLSAVGTAALSPRYDIVSLLIGVNNQYQGKSKSQYEIEFTTLLKKSIELAGNKPNHVIVLSIPDYSTTPFAREGDTAFIASEINAFNIINKKIADAYRVCYIDVTGESRMALHDASLVADDGLHYSEKEYEIWAEKIVKEVISISTGKN